MATISTSKLMSLARRGASGIKKKSGRRGHRRNATKNLAVKAGKGIALGLAISIPLTLAARYFNKPILMEVGQRFGSVASTAVGGTPGNAAYQAADAVFDRFVSFQGQGISGQPLQVYL